ncbi:MAG: V-type ATP synthase subunit A, partial [Candidatus Omnitrophica bacterium]|nr:V-type ATP synthase subunit A [Candidatus Omnitrophota bacterium]
EMLDTVYLQQNGYDKVDSATSLQRQEYVFGKVYFVLNKEFNFDKKENARKSFYELRQLFIDWNYKEWDSGEFKSQEGAIDKFLEIY